MSERIVATDGHEGYWYTGEEIVRCRDCRYMLYYHAEESEDRKDFYWCMLTDWKGGIQLYRDSGFCAWGERRAADGATRRPRRPGTAGTAGR